MAQESDPDAPSPQDRGLAIALTLLFAALVSVAFVVHKLVQWRSSGTNATPANLSNGTPPLLTRPQLLENQQAMPEMLDFDPQNPPQNPINGSGPIGTPTTPSTLGTGSLGQ